MRALDIQRGARELGRIRLGYSDGPNSVKKLNKFRLTSNDQNALEAAARIYGGKVTHWEGGRQAFQLFTNVSEMPIVVSQKPVTTGYEKWGDGGPEHGFCCLRRCDGRHIVGGLEAKKAGQVVHECRCDPDPKQRAADAKVKGSDACSLVGRVWVELPQVPDHGVWMCRTGSFYAASELPQTMDALQAFASIGMRLGATLAIDVRRAGKKAYPVLILRVAQSAEDLNRMALAHIERMKALGDGRFSEQAARFAEAMALQGGEIKAITQGGQS